MRGKAGRLLPLSRSTALRRREPRRSARGRPRARTVTVYRPNGDAHRYTATDTLTSDDAAFPVEGFELPVAKIFE